MMNFVWEMKKESWKELMEDNKRKGDLTFDKGNNFYGHIFVGNLCAEVMHTHDDSDWYAYVNVYGLGIDSCYGKTEDGTPYALLDDGPILPMDATSFEEFKERFEKAFKDYINTDEQRMNLAKMPLGKWQYSRSSTYK